MMAKTAPQKARRKTAPVRSIEQIVAENKKKIAARRAEHRTKLAALRGDLERLLDAYESVAEAVEDQDGLSIMRLLSAAQMQTRDHLLDWQRCPPPYTHEIVEAQHILAQLLEHATLVPIHYSVGCQNRLPKPLADQLRRRIAHILKRCAELDGGESPTKSSVRRPLLADGERELWDALDGGAMTAKELTAHLDRPSEEAVRQQIASIRHKCYEIVWCAGRGYYRPDALPPDVSRT